MLISNKLCFHTAVLPSYILLVAPRVAGVGSRNASRSSRG